MSVRIEYNSEPIPGYKLIERLGGGGFGEVWKCEAPGGLHKAIKFVFGSLEFAGDSDQRTKQELKALDRVKTVRHPYILSLERYDIIDGQLLIVMELADRNLWDRFKECRSEGLPGIPREELLRYMEESAEALDLMNNTYQLQHLDIKPQNIFLIHQHVKVADFGLVKDLEGSQALVTGGITPVYAAPETFDGMVTRFSDQYSLGIVFQELLTGQRPFAGTNVRQLIMQHLSAEPNLTPLNPRDRPIIGRSLHKEPNQRYPTCLDMVRDLRAATREPAALASPEEGATREHSSPPLAVSPSNLQDAPQTLRDGSGHRTPSGQPERAPVTPSPAAREPAPHVPDKRRPSRDSSPSVTECIRSPGRSAPNAPEAETPSRTAPVPERAEPDGDGTLAPTLVIGLGGLGRTVLSSFRSVLVERFGNAESPANVRLLLLDTDPAATKPAEKETDVLPLSPAEVLLTPLNRPSHYLRPRDGRANVDEWLPTRLLYRIPREAVTTGLRGLGRLAFCDNFRVILKRLVAELEACRDPLKLKQAAEQTGLGVRTSRPRVYLVTGLMGGTGSGMFLDVAYAVRHALLRMGYDQPDVVGLLFAPLISTRTSRQGTSNPGVPLHVPPGGAGAALRAASPVPGGNACAALAELHHFAQPNTEFSARYLEKEPPLRDAGSPFARTVVLAIPDEAQTRAAGEVVGMAARFLLGDSCYGLERLSLTGRSGLPVPPSARLGQYCETFGMYRLTFPRRQIVRRVAGQCLVKIVTRWISKDARSLEEAVRARVEEQWRGSELAAEHFIARVQQACEKGLGKAPEAAFSAAMGARLASGGNTLGGKGAKVEPRKPATVINPEDVAEVMARYEALIGRPESVDDAANVGAAPPPTPPMLQTLREAAKGLAGEWSQKLAEFPVRLIEKPEFRLAGAEEAVRQVVAFIEKVLDIHEPLARELSERATQAYARLMVLLSQSNDPRSWPRRGTVTPEDVLELLRNYPKWRYQALVLQQVLGVYVSLRGHLTDTLREINGCRLRLSELALDLGARLPSVGPKEEADPPKAQGRKPSDEFAVEREGPGKYLFPGESEDLAQAVSRVASTLGREELLEMDGCLQKAVRSQFGSLVQVCLATKNVTHTVARVLREAAETFVDAHMEQSDTAALFRARHPGEDAALDELVGLYEEAVPEPSRTVQARTVSAQSEVTILTVPAGRDGEAVRDLARTALSETSLVTAVGGDDLMVYREWSNLALTDLENLGPVGQEAYQQLRAADNYPPHARQDIEFELPL